MHTDVSSSRMKGHFWLGGGWKIHGDGVQTAGNICEYLYFHNENIDDNKDNFFLQLYFERN